MDLKKLVPGSKVEIIKDNNMQSDTHIGDTGTIIESVMFYPGTDLIPDVRVLIGKNKWYIDISALKVLKYGVSHE